jgi:hypothetical protein
MRPDPNYPRWMFHRRKPMVMVHNEEEELALGRDWSRVPIPAGAALPPEEKPLPQPEEEEPEEEEPVEEPHPATVPVRPPVRKPAARKPAARTKTHKR